MRALVQPGSLRRRDTLRTCKRCRSIWDRLGYEVPGALPFEGEESIQMTIPPGGNSLVIYRRSGVIGFLAFVVAALAGMAGAPLGRLRQRSASRRRCRRRPGRCSNASCCGAAPAPARSSSTDTSTTGAISNASSAGAATTGPTTPSRTSTTGPSSTRSAAADSILTLFKKAWEGHLRQYTAGPDDRGAVRTRRDVLQGIPRHVRLAAQRRGTVGLQPRGPVRPAGCRGIRQRVTRLRRVLPER